MQPTLLRRRNLLFLWINVIVGAAVARIKTVFVSIVVIAFDNVAAADVWLAIVLSSQCFDIHPILAALHLFFEDINAHVIASRDPAAAGVDEQFDKAGP